MSKTILCADDSATMQTVAEITFRATDYQYVGARSADEALSKARANKPALILADVVMPGKDGYDLCQAVKSDPALADVPVVMMCGKSQVYDQAKGEKVGADGHLTKPWDSQVMIDKVGELLAKVASEGVASIGGAAAAVPTPIAARPAPTPPAPAPVTAPPRPAPIPAPNPAAARSATIMGMPTIQMPPKLGVATPATPLGTKPASATPATPTLKPPTPPPVAKPPTPAPAPVAARAPVSTPPRGTPAVASSASPEGLSRAPLVKGAPKKRPPVPQRPAATLAARVASKLPSAAEQIALETGLDPKGPEIAALVKVTHEVIERIVWEVVPEIAEAMIRENFEDLTRKARS